MCLLNALVSISGGNRERLSRALTDKARTEEYRVQVFKVWLKIYIYISLTIGAYLHHKLPKYPICTAWFNLSLGIYTL